ncbi:MAG TPA: hypothetical protein VMZ31_04995 [Phycisphaerae bacterium]|nr:hypothetical protein [Phycisphaerae bacterium]
MMNSSTWIPISFLFVGLGVAAPGLASSFTPQDILEGVKAREESISDIQLKFAIKDVNEDAFYAAMRERVARMPEEEIQRQHLRRADGTLVMPVPGDKSLDRERVRAWDFRRKGDQVAFDAYTFRDGTRIHEAMVAYNGERLKWLNVHQGNGQVTPASLDTILNRVPSLDTLLGVENSALSDYGDADNVELSVGQERFVDDELVVEVTARRTFSPGAGLPLNVVTETTMEILPQKSFWPKSIQKVVTLKDVDTGESVSRLRLKTVVSGFVESDGVYYPTEFVTREYDHAYEYHEGSSLPKVSEESRLLSTTTVSVDSVAVNTGLEGEKFDFEFPKGTVIHDDLLGVGFTVGDLPEAMARQMAATQLPTRTEGMTRAEYDRLLRESQGVAGGRKTQVYAQPEESVESAPQPREEPTPAIAVTKELSLGPIAYAVMVVAGVLVGLGLLRVFRRRSKERVHHA